MGGNWSELRDILGIDLPSSEKLVFLALRIRQGENATCWPNQQTIAADTGLSERTVRTITRNLELVGIIKVRRRGKPGSPKEYTLITGSGCRKSPATDSGEYRQSATAIPATASAEIKKNEKGKEKGKSAGARLSIRGGLRAPRIRPAMSPEEIARMQADPVAYWEAIEARA